MTTQRQNLATYALTISTFQQHRHFQRTAHAELFLATLQRYRSQGKFLLPAFAVMPDHVGRARVHACQKTAAAQALPLCRRLASPPSALARSTQAQEAENTTVRTHLRDPVDGVLWVPIVLHRVPGRGAQQLRPATGTGV